MRYLTRLQFDIKFQALFLHIMLRTLLMIVPLNATLQMN